jgi:hypothetical protein
MIFTELLTTAKMECIVVRAIIAQTISATLVWKLLSGWMQFGHDVCYFRSWQRQMHCGETAHWTIYLIALGFISATDQPLNRTCNYSTAPVNLPVLHKIQY